MWIAKFYGTFTSTAKRNAAAAFLDARLAPGTGNIAPADRRRAIAWGTDPDGNTVNGGTLIYEYDTAPSAPAIRNLWANRTILLDNTPTNAGCLQGVLVIARVDNTARPVKVISLVARPSVGAALVDARDMDVPATENVGVLNQFYPGAA